MPRHTYSNFINALNTVGFRFYDSGIVKDKNNKKIGDYVKGDNLTQEQKIALQKILGDRVQFMIAQSQYAPEQIKPIVMFKTVTKKQAVHVIQ